MSVYDLTCTEDLWPLNHSKGRVNVELLNHEMKQQEDEVEQEHDETQHLIHPQLAGRNDDDKEEHEEEEECHGT